MQGGCLSRHVSLGGAPTHRDNCISYQVAAVTLMLLTGEMKEGNTREKASHVLFFKETKHVVGFVSFEYFPLRCNEKMLRDTRLYFFC